MTLTNEILLEIRDLLRENLEARKVLAEKRDRNAKRMREKRGLCADVRAQDQKMCANVRAQCAHNANKEVPLEKGRKNLPPLNPLLERTLKDTPPESTTTTTDGSRAREGDSGEGARVAVTPPVAIAHEIPTLEDVLQFVKKRKLEHPEYAHKWYDEMTNVYFWMDPKTGGSIHHWRVFFMACYRREYSEAAKKIVEVHHIQERAKPLNYRASRKEDITNAF